MRRHLSTITLLLVVALAAAGGGYALGTQTGGGTAAAVNRAHAARPVRHRVSLLAQKLGVQPAQLRDALRTLRAQRMAARRRALAGDLAGILGVPEARVESALAAVPPRARWCRGGRRRP